MLATKIHDLSSKTASKKNDLWTKAAIFPLPVVFDGVQ